MHCLVAEKVDKGKKKEKKILNIPRLETPPKEISYSKLNSSFLGAVFVFIFYFF